MKRVWSLVLVLATMYTLGVPAHAQSGNPIRIINGFPPGGAVDILSREIAERLRQSLGEAVIVENRPGASTMLAMDALKRAAPDGRTMLVNFSAPFVLFPYTYQKLNYKVEDFKPVSQLVTFPLALTTNAAKPYKTLAQYRDFARKKGDTTVGMPGLGTAAHFAVLELTRSMDIALVPVSYKGGTQLLNDELAGHLDLTIDTIASKIEMYRHKRLSILGVTGSKRSTLAPEVPTLLEQGVEGSDYPSGWYGLFVPAGTPQAAVDRLERAIASAMADRSLQARLYAMGLEPADLGSKDFEAVVASDGRYWKPIVSASGFVATP